MNGITIENKGKQHKIRRKLDNNVTSTENQGKHHTIHKKLGTQRNIHTIQETAMQNPQKAIENNVKIHMIDPYKQA